jgi:hypothetical protein
MRRARAPIAALLVLLSLAWAGCGPFGGRSDKEEAGDTVTALIDARNQFDWPKVCDLLATSQLQKFRKAGTTCVKALPQVAQRGTTTTIRIEQVRVSGDRATVDATVSQTGGAGRAQTILLVKENGDWKVSKVGF